jgi:hypothetical protein
MTIAAGKHVRLAATGDDLRHRGMVVRVPVRRQEAIPRLTDAERCRAVRNVPRLAVIRRQLEVRRIDRIGPSWRAVLARRRRHRHDCASQWNQQERGKCPHRSSLAPLGDPLIRGADDGVRSNDPPQLRSLRLRHRHRRSFRPPRAKKTFSSAPKPNDAPTKRS